jgi:hypothetical protein
MSLLHIYGGDKMSQYDKTDSDEMHDLLIEMINEVGRDMEVYEIRKKPFEKRNESLRPSMAYRTADLLSYIYKKCNKENKKLQAIHILEKCFFQCTRAVLYYINLEDLKTIILRHRNEKVWCICIENSSDM